MGDLQTDQGDSLELRFVPVSEFARVVTANADPVSKAAAFAALARINTLYMIAGAWSGHIGTSFSSLEIMSWLFLNELRDLDKGADACDVFFSSKGHDAPALYSVLLGLGLLSADKLHQLRRIGGLPGHPHVETPYIQANTGSLGMGISKAKGMALANRMAHRERRIFVLTGDGELQEGQFWESLGSAANLRLGEIVAIVDRIASAPFDPRLDRPVLTQHRGIIYQGQTLGARASSLYYHLVSKTNRMQGRCRVVTTDWAALWWCIPAIPS